ncbi:MAG: 2-hydroxyglutaryl-CoA dehydratase [Provencibacterium sp.]|jgi:predicted CoA-substrate-specific enzyme activase|nr:2-hydroxyglutaryl-CoA dehydratase [Provencibacterium sp.]
MYYKVGIDIGSTTLKCVVLDDNDNIVYKSYERHLSKVRQMTRDKFIELEKLLKGKDLKVALTGSAGLGVSEKSGLPFVQEVFATSGAARAYYPETDAVIELGGEDAKIIFLQGTPEERMNSTCAGGTGSFIDQMAALLAVNLEELDALSLAYSCIYPIASRCGVFAKTDIQPLINQGARKEDLAASIFQAVVDQTIAGLAQGRPIEGNVLFLGGPLAFLKGLQQRFVETLGLTGESAVFPALAPYFVALGAAVYAAGLHKTYRYGDLLDAMETALQSPNQTAGLEPLFASEEDYERFRLRHQSASVQEADIARYTGNAYLGIDAGSTTTKLALITEDEQLLYSHYCRNEGNPMQVVLEELRKIYALLGDRVKIAGSAVTGYGEELMIGAFNVDAGIVETVAHYTAARHFNPNVSFIIDIGGQDMKCFHIRDNAIDSVLLNEACSSGCGSFIETFAGSMGYPIADFARLGLFARHPVDLGTRCTVFMNSSVKQAQKDGAPVEDISAGLSISVVKNALYKVIRVHSPAELGENIVVQGGTFLNDSVLRSFEKELGVPVIRPVIAGLMGAYGAALIAKERMQGKESRLMSAQELEAFAHESKPVVCRGCTNHCRLTINTFPGGRRFISGNKCERPVTGNRGDSLPNLYRYKLSLLEALPAYPNRRGRMGLPLALNFYDLLPFWHTFFGELGFETVVSPPSTRRLYASGQATIPSDTVCFPAKVAHGHIRYLVEQGVDAVFYPCMTYNLDEKMSDNCYNCPVVAYYPEVIKGNMGLPESLPFLYPYISLNDPKFFAGRITGILQEHFPGISRKEVSAAAKRAFAALEDFRAAVRAEGARAIRYAHENGLRSLILAGRPYHADPLINHGIDNLISSLGFVVLSEDALEPMPEYRRPNVLNQWTYHARMYNAAQRCLTMPDTELVQLVSFGCGIDAITSDEVKDILRSGGKLYTQIKIDEINNLGAVKIRLRSLSAAMDERAGR